MCNNLLALYMWCLNISKMVPFPSLSPYHIHIWDSSQCLTSFGYTITALYVYVTVCTRCVSMLSVDMERVEICTLATYIRICTYVAQSLCKHTVSSMINCICTCVCSTVDMITSPSGNLLQYVEWSPVSDTLVSGTGAERWPVSGTVEHVLTYTAVKCSLTLMNAVFAFHVPIRIGLIIRTYLCTTHLVQT